MGINCVPLPMVVFAEIARRRRQKQCQWTRFVEAQVRYLADLPRTPSSLGKRLIPCRCSFAHHFWLKLTNKTPGRAKPLFSPFPSVVRKVW